LEEAVEDMADERVGVISSLKEHYNDKPSGYIEEDTHIKVINTSGTINYKGKPIPFFGGHPSLSLQEKVTTREHPSLSLQEIRRRRK